MPISEVLIPKEARRTTLKLTRSILENLDGAFTNPSLIISFAYFILPNLNPNVLVVTAKVVPVIKRPCNRNDRRIPKVPKPVDTKAYPVINLMAVPIISINNMFFTSEIPSNAKRKTKPGEEIMNNAMAIQAKPRNDS